jgi:hypothetical protein
MENKMKRLVISLLLGAIIMAWHGFAFAGNWGGWGDWSRWRNWEESEKKNSQDAGEKGKKNPAETAPSEKRFCSYEQESELLELLRELKDPSLSNKKPGGESEVRRKYRIARRLRKFDDCRAEDALKELIKENACEDLGEGEVFCVRWRASASLQEVKSKKDLKKLTPETSLEDQLKIFKKYGPHPHENEFASHAVMTFLLEQVDVNPKVYVPLLVEYFTTCHEIMPIVRKYPKETNIGLKRCFFSTEPTVVWAGINLARKLGRTELFPTVYDVAFEKIGPLDYSQQEDIEEIQTAAIAFFRTHEKDAVRYYRGILYGDFDRGKEYVISGIKDLANPELLTLLKEFSSWLQSQPEKADDLLTKRLQKKIGVMMEVQK